MRLGKGPRRSAADAAREAEALDDLLESELKFETICASFETARSITRSITIFSGPPNSGKTFAAFEALRNAESGAYLSSLRLLALEARDDFDEKGLPCSLVTGEDVSRVDGATHVAATVECCDLQLTVDLAVIDEAQNLFDPSRGWAWTHALLGCPARELIIICAAYAVPAITAILACCGETPVVRTFERKQGAPRLLEEPVPLTGLQPGDAVVSFARIDALVFHDKLQAGAGPAGKGLPTAVVYGALPPEVRRAEAERFASGSAVVLSATDAIGQGLNLPISRVLFTSCTKFDGREVRLLGVGETHQIAGRAGRFGVVEGRGAVGVLELAPPGSLGLLRGLLEQAPTAPPSFRASIAPTAGHIATIAERLRLTQLQDVLEVFTSRLRAQTSATFVLADPSRLQDLAARLDDAAPRLSVADRFAYATAPINSRDGALMEEYLSWAAAHSARGTAGVPYFLLHPAPRDKLIAMEAALRATTLWLFLALKFPDVFLNEDEAILEREELSLAIADLLVSSRRLAGPGALTTVEKQGRK